MLDPGDRCDRGVLEPLGTFRPCSQRKGLAATIWLCNVNGSNPLLGKEQPLTLVATATEEKDGKTRLTGNFKIKQTDYGIKPYSAGFGLAAVTDELVIHGDVWIAAAP